jgi:hypothetical protein
VEAGAEACADTTESKEEAALEGERSEERERRTVALEPTPRHRKPRRRRAGRKGEGELIVEAAAEGVEQAEAEAAAAGGKGEVASEDVEPEREGSAAASEPMRHHQGSGPWRLTLLEEVEVAMVEWTDDKVPKVEDAGTGPCNELDQSEASGKIVVTFDNSYEETRSYDFVWLATGSALDISLVPLLASLQAQRPIPMYGAGLPHLQPDLSWAPGCPLHVMGAFAQLQLGPDALNLAGARSGGALLARTILEAQRAGKDVKDREDCVSVLCNTTLEEGYCDCL